VADFSVKTLLNHPFSFAVGVGLANGLLAFARQKKIDFKTAATLSVILGLGEAALVMYEPEEERGEHSLSSIAVLSVAGVMLGVAPFIEWSPRVPAEHKQKVLPLAAGPGDPAETPAPSAGVAGRLPARSSLSGAPGAAGGTLRRWRLSRSMVSG
jgi:hypothetical protein